MPCGMQDTSSALAAPCLSPSVGLDPEPWCGAGEARALPPSRAELPGGRALTLPRHCSNFRGYGGVSHRARRKRQKPASGAARPPSDAGSFSVVHVSVSPGQKFCKAGF